jgi:hypothetical protein
MRLNRAWPAAILFLAGCNHNDSNSPTFAERTDHVKQNVREGLRPSEHSTLDENYNDTYQPSAQGTYRSTTTYQTTYPSDRNTTYQRDQRDYRTTDVPTSPR